MIRRCRVCEQAFFHPKASCPRCSSSDTEWFQASGRGTVYSFVINHRSPPGLEPPFVIAVIELEEGPLMMSVLTGIDTDKVRCGISVEAVYDDQVDGVTLPKFRPANSNGGK
jgi:hypothetical protein